MGKSPLDSQSGKPFSGKQVTGTSIQRLLWVSSSSGSSLANEHSSGRPELYRELLPMEGEVLTDISCYTLVRCFQSSTGSLLPLPPNLPLPLDWMPSVLKLSWERGTHRGERDGCPSAVHQPSSQGQICRLFAWSNFPLILSKQALLLLISPTFPLALPLPHLTGRLVGNQYPGEPVWAERDPSLLTSVLQLPSPRSEVIG